jgi:predicted aspartyl protease
MKTMYRADYRPPIPALAVRLYSPVTDRFADQAIAVIDTGSDATMVPLRYLTAIGAQETTPGWLVTVTGQRQAVALYFVDIYLEQEVAPGMRVIGDETGVDIILGRDFLNRFALFLDGPLQQLTVPDPAALRRLRTS